MDVYRLPPATPEEAGLPVWVRFQSKEIGALKIALRAYQQTGVRKEPQNATSERILSSKVISALRVAIDVSMYNRDPVEQNIYGDGVPHVLAVLSEIAKGRLAPLPQGIVEPAVEEVGLADLRGLIIAYPDAAEIKLPAQRKAETE